MQHTKHLLPNGNVVTIDKDKKVVKGTVGRPRTVRMPNGFTQVNHYLADKKVDRAADEAEAQKHVDDNKHKPYEFVRHNEFGVRVK